MMETKLPHLEQLRYQFYGAISAEYPKDTVVYFRHNSAQRVPTLALVHDVTSARVCVRYIDSRGRTRYKSADYRRFSKVNL